MDNPQDSTYQDELNGLIEEYIENSPVELDGERSLFEQAYEAIVANIAAAGNTYVMLRLIEDAISGGDTDVT